MNTTMRYIDLAQDDLRVAIRCLEDPKSNRPVETRRLDLLKYVFFSRLPSGGAGSWSLATPPP
jgi:hypothetical protein